MNKNTKGKRWCFTLNNYEEQDLDLISGYPCTFLIYGLEVGDTLATPHVQGYVEFKSQKRLGTLKKWLPRAHFERAIGTAEQNIAYCSKQDKSPFKKGIPSSKVKKVNAKKILKHDPINGQKIVAAKRAYLGMKLEKDMLGEILLDNLQKPKITYIYGATGTGKTYTALKLAVTNYDMDEISTIKFDKNGFCHCNNPMAECLIWMEFRPSCLAATDFLELTDGYGCHLNVKHGGMYIRPKHIYICSILAPHEIYKEEINAQFQRRITEFINKDDNPYHNYIDEGEEVHWSDDELTQREAIYRI